MARIFSGTKITPGDRSFYCCQSLHLDSDESTGSLDPVAETQLLDRLLENRRGKMTILISHRPRVIVRSDWVVFFERGTLKLQGSPEELCQTAGNHLDF